MEAGNEPPADDTPATSAEMPTEDKRDGPSGPPGPLLPVDRWTVDKTRISLNEHVEKEARSRSRPRRANETEIASQRERNALITLPDVQPQGFETCLEPYDSRVGHEGADDALSNSASSENSAVETCLRNVAAGDNARERARLEAALRPVDLEDSGSEVHPEDEIVTVLDPEDEPDPSGVTSDVTMEEAPELSEEVRRFREANDRTIDTYAAVGQRMDGTATGCPDSGNYQRLP